MTKGAPFCAFCGTRISNQADPVSAAAQYEHIEERITDADIEGKAKWDGNISPETHSISKPLDNAQTPLTCFKCGAKIPAESNFCPVCQTQLFVTCPNCGHIYSAKYSICSECGAKYQEEINKQVTKKMEEQKEEEDKYQEFLHFLEDSDLVIVRGGTFRMGATPEQGPVKNNSDRNPVHSVTVDTFIISRYLITQNLWFEVMGYNPSHFINGMNPVESISFEELCNFIKAAQEYYDLPFRLPTEAEWEYAARGGALSQGYKYPGGNDIAELGWVKANSGGQPHPVGLKKPNELGLYDMAGNVWELVEDIYDSKFYSKSPRVNPCNTKHRSDFSAWWHESYGNHVMRGGSFCYNADDATSSYRYEHVENTMFGNYKDVGFRLALDFPSSIFPGRE